MEECHCASKDLTGKRSVTHAVVHVHQEFTSTSSRRSTEAGGYLG